jgi:tetratricopeptide (TPR) repeat protein
VHGYARYAEAVADFDEVLKSTPNDLATLSNRGYSHRKLGQYAAAVDDYARAIALSPDSVRLYNNRGYCCAKLGRCVHLHALTRPACLLRAVNTCCKCYYADAQQIQAEHLWVFIHASKR